LFYQTTYQNDSTGKAVYEAEAQKNDFTDEVEPCQIRPWIRLKISIKLFDYSATKTLNVLCILGALLEIILPDREMERTKAVVALGCC